MTPALTFDGFIRILKRVTPPSYHNPIINDPRGSFALYRSMARIFEKLAARIERSVQSTFYLRHSKQTGPPASSGVRATFDAEIRRAFDLQEPRFIDVGAMRIDGPLGREYFNVDVVEWIPFDTEQSKTVSFQAPAVGTQWNLDDMADANGRITAPQEEPERAWTERIDIAAISAGRTGINGTIEQATTLDVGSVIIDSGRPDRLNANDTGLYVRLINASNPENLGRVLRVLDFEAPGLVDPPDSGLVPRRITVDDGPQRFRLTSARADDGGAFTDQTVAANEESPDDMTLLPAAPAVGDAYYFGAQDPFQSLQLDVSTRGGGDYDLAWEYFDGAVFTALPALGDRTDGFREAGSNLVDWTVPGDWAAVTVDGAEAFYVRARVAVFVSLTQQPLGQSAFVNIQEQLLSEVGTVHWAILDWRDLGFELAQIDAPSGGRDAILRILGEERGAFQQDGENDDAFRERAARLADAVSPNAINRTVNQILSEFGFEGGACDVQNGFQGFFLDVDPSFSPGVVSALDLYEDGDLFPLDKTQLILNKLEAKGFFFVKVPRIGLGESGPFLDESPVLQILSTGELITNAADSAFLDGFAGVANQIYSRIFNAIETQRAGGIGFTLIIDPNPPKCA